MTKMIREVTSLNSNYGSYRQRYFTQIFPNSQDFLEEWKESGIYDQGLVSDTSIERIYYLIYARYGNSTIASYDETQFKYKVFSIIYEYAPTWEKSLRSRRN